MRSNALVERPGDAPAGSACAVDFEVGGSVRLRLIDPSPSDVDGVVRQLGPLQAQLSGSPDIEVRYVDRLPDPGRLRYVALRECAFSDNEFVVLRGPGGVVAPAYVRLHETPVQITCRHDTAAVPLLVPLVNAAAVRHGVVPVHAAAFRYGDQGVLVGGWAKGGKTELLLTFVAHGAQYVGDEWVYLDPSLDRMSGLPEPMRIHSWQARQVPELWRRLPARARARMRFAEVTIPSIRRGAGGRPRAQIGAWTERAAQAARTRWASTRIPPARLFGPEACAGSVTIDHVVLATTAPSEMVTAEPIDGATIAERLAASARYERARLAAAYEQFRYAFPGVTSENLVDLDVREARLIAAAIGAKPATIVTHPHPVELSRLFAAVAPVVAGAMA